MNVLDGKFVEVTSYVGKLNNIRILSKGYWVRFDFINFSILNHTYIIYFKFRCWDVYSSIKLTRATERFLMWYTDKV